MSMTRTRVSIVVPSFQQGHYIRETIDSVLSQDYRDIELIVMDGGSTDETLEVLQSYSDPRLTWRSEHDRGQSHAINKGLKLAQGEFVSYLNSDDLLRPGAVSQIVEFFDENPEKQVIHGDMDEIDEKGEVFNTMFAVPFDLLRTLAGMNSIFQPGTFWRRGMTDRIGWFREDLHFCMDVEYWIRAALEGEKICYSKGIRSAFRYHDASKTVSRTEEFLREWQMIYDLLRRKYEHDLPMLGLLRICQSEYDWNISIQLWNQGKLSLATPLLRRVITKSTRLKRKVFAGLLLIDANLHTDIAHAVQRTHRSLRGCRGN